MKRFSIAALVLFALLAFVSANAIAAGKAMTMVDDSAITTAVKAKLANNTKYKTLTTIEVNTTEGVVTLAGSADSKAMKDEAGKLAKSVKGVKKVVNSLQVTNKKMIE